MDIIHRMAVLDPTGDWMSRGARALDNPHSINGELSLEHKAALMEDLENAGRESQAFVDLQSRLIFRRGPGNGAANSSTS